MQRLAFETIQRLDLPVTEIVAGRIGFIHDLFLTLPYEVANRLPEGDRDLVVLIGKERRRERLEELAEYPGRVLVVAAPGDASFRSAYLPDRPCLPPNFVAVFTTNNQLADSRAIGIPLGVRANKLLALQFVRQNRIEPRDRLAYANFTVNDWHYKSKDTEKSHIRAMLSERLAGEPWVTLDVEHEQRDTPEELIQYYSAIARHRFVLSPEGNGVDCYRTWEALYLGAIPIVMASPAMSCFAGLPFLFTEDYSELSSSYLERVWADMSGRTFDIEPMLKSYYAKQFLDYVALLENPRFVCWKFDTEKFLRVLKLSSHSPSGVVAESPAPPFTSWPSLSTVEAWHAPGGLRVEADAEGMRVAVETEKRMFIETPLQTIAGGPFRLSGRIRREGASRGGLAVKFEDRPDVIAAVEVGDEPETRLELDIVARSQRSVLQIEAVNAEVGASWLVDDLKLSTNLPTP